MQWKKEISHSKIIWLRVQPMKHKLLHHMAAHFQLSLNIHGRSILPIILESHKEVSRTSTFRPLVIPETKKPKIITNLKIVTQTINRCSHDTSQHTLMASQRNWPVNNPAKTNPSIYLSLPKKSNVTERCIKYEKYSCVRKRNKRTPRYFQICASSLRNTNGEDTHLVVNFLKGGTLKFYFKMISP